MSADRQPYLVLRVAGSLCALPVAQVAEVLRPPALTGETGAVPGLLGVARLRGVPVPVFALAALLGMEPGQEQAEPSARRLVRVALGGVAAALLVDEVLDIQLLAPGELETLHLPGDRVQEIGRFDRAFARLIDASGLIPELPRAEPA